MKKFLPILSIFITFLCLFIFSSPNSVWAKPSLIFGKIKSQENGELIAGVKVKIENSGFVTKTDQKGEFSLDYAPGEFRILFRKIGFFPYAITLNISSKSYFPLEEINLKPAPKLVDIFGQPVENADLLVQKGFDKAINLNEKTNSEGEYTFDYFEGDCRIGFKKQGFRTDFYGLNLNEKKYPGINPFILCPDKFGLYLKDKHIPPTESTLRKPQRKKHTGGGLYIPKPILSWEGEYFMKKEPTSIQGGRNSFFLFPTSTGRLGPGGDALESVPGLHLLKVGPDGKFAEFGSTGGTFNQIECQMTPVLKRRAFYSGGLASQRINIFRIDINLPPGRYVFCEFEKPPLNKFFVPTKYAYYFQIGNNGSSESIITKTRCNTEKSNLKFGVYKLFFKECIEFDIANTYKSIEGVIDKNEYYDNVLKLVEGYFLIRSKLNDEKALELMADALSTVGYISSVFGVNDYMPIVISFLGTALKTYVNPSPESITTYVAINSLSAVNNILSASLINSKRKKYETMTGIRDVIHEYYFSCANWDLIERKLDVSGKLDDCTGERLACITKAYLNNMNFHVDMKQIIDSNNAVVLGVNNLCDLINKQELTNKISGDYETEQSSAIAAPKNSQFSGIWKGKGYQHDGQSWSITFERQSERCKIEYPSLSCGGELKIMEEKDNYLKLRETITFGKNKCFSGGEVVLRMKDDKTTEYFWYYPNGKKGAEGMLYK